MLIRTGSVALRSFEPSQTEALYEVRNHPSVRRHMREPAPIARESHERWVREHLIDARRVHLFVAHSTDVPVGITLLRNFAAGQAEIGVMVIEAQRRRRFCYTAAYLTAHYAFELVGLESMLSYVPRHNEHALAFNLGCGFERTGADPEPYFELRFTRKTWLTHPVHRRFRGKHPIEVR